MLTTKEKTKEAELIFTTYLRLPERERTMILAYTTALRDKMLAEEQVRQPPEQAVQ
ncbi:MAG: hypothetical protein K2M91_06955 [Lachnospiraceae bacterium]|nr:hypothetical protein [Lachnospiraceae bacterium]